MQTEVILCLGGNRGDRKKLLAQAIESLQVHFLVLKASAIYETPAWGGVAKGDFLNQVVMIQTSESAAEVLAITQDIEKKLGRSRAEHWGDRTMDIDILYFGDQIIDSEKLKVPHPFLTERKFVLEPLAELIPTKIHPVLGKNSLELLKECTDTSEVHLFKK